MIATACVFTIFLAFFSCVHSFFVGVGNNHLIALKAKNKPEDVKKGFLQGMAQTNLLKSEVTKMMDDAKTSWKGIEWELTSRAESKLIRCLFSVFGGLDWIACALTENQ